MVRNACSAFGHVPAAMLYLPCPSQLVPVRASRKRGIVPPPLAFRKFGFGKSPWAIGALRKDTHVVYQVTQQRSLKRGIPRNHFWQEFKSGGVSAGRHHGCLCRSKWTLITVSVRHKPAVGLPSAGGDWAADVGSQIPRPNNKVVTRDRGHGVGAAKREGTALARSRGSRGAADNAGQCGR